MGTIVAIGGGEIDTKETLAIDKEIVRLSGKKNPKLLFIPTASTDEELYCQEMQAHYGKILGCEVSFLKLIQNPPSKTEIEKVILSADIVFVGGGNTLKMMRRWRTLGVDKILKKAYDKGIVLCGVSAGSICWFEYGHSDSLSYYNPKKWKYIRVKGLGFIKGTHCPHYDSETLGIPRKDRFKKMMRTIGGMGIAIDNNCAIVFRDSTYRVIDSAPQARAYKVFKQKGQVVEKEIAKEPRPAPIADLYTT